MDEEEFAERIIKEGNCNFAENCLGCPINRQCGYQTSDEDTVEESIKYLASLEVMDKQEMLDNINSMACGVACIKGILKTQVLEEGIDDLIQEEMTKIFAIHDILFQELNK